MKKKIFYLAIFLIFSCSIFSQGLKDVFSPGSNIVFAVGSNGFTLRSTNGGDFFTSSFVGNSTLNSVYATGNYVWSAGNSGKLNFSSNSGINWQAIASGTNSDLKSVYFIDNSTGFICGNNGTISKTTNSGAVWIALTTGTSNNLNDIKFKNSNTGFACGSGGLFLKTTNGGSSWVNMFSGIANELLSIDVKLNTVFVTGKRAGVYKSTNEGLSWNYIDYKLTTYSDINCINMIDENTHFSCGGGGFIRKSTDGGSVYSYQSNPMLAKLNSMYFIDGNTGWAVGESNNVVIKTTNGGANWNLYQGTTINYTWSRVLNLPPNLKISGKTIAINHINPEILFAAGGNIMYRSSDNGLTWLPAFTMPVFNTCAGLLTNHYDSSKFLVILRDNTANFSTLYKTTNYGLNWVQLYMGPLANGGMPIEEDPMHPDTVYFGASGNLFRSTDFGSNLIPISNLPILRFCDMAISYFDHNTIFVSSNFSSRLFRSTNWGLNFTRVDTSAVYNSEMPAVVTSPYSPLNVYHVFIGNTVDALRKSTDGGNTWFNGYVTPIMWGLDIAKDDPNILFSFNYDTNGVDKGFVNISFDNGSTYIHTSIRENLTGNIDQSIFNTDRANCFDIFDNEIYKLIPIYNTTIGIQQISTEIPNLFSLSQNYPNPFNPVTSIEFSLPAVSFVSLSIYDISGKEIQRMLNSNITAGKYKIEWNASSFASGIYFYSITAGDYNETKKMVLVK